MGFNYYEARMHMNAKIVNDLLDKGVVKKAAVYYNALENYGMGRRSVDEIIKTLCATGRAVDKGDHLARS